MTYLEKYMELHPDYDAGNIVSTLCPGDIFEGAPNADIGCGGGLGCPGCWDQELPEEVKIKKKEYESPSISVDHNVPIGRAWNIDIPDGFKKAGASAAEASAAFENTAKILDSGTRREFETGAVRDIQEGKGRCDLMPLDVVAEWFKDTSVIDPYPERTKTTYCVLTNIHNFQTSGGVTFLNNALSCFMSFNYDYIPTMFLEVSKHFEEGAKKYGENNWQKGIPVRCYIDSAVRHYLKFLRGDKDEPHDRAFCWNIMCAIWTCKHKPELNDYDTKREKA